MIIGDEKLGIRELLESDKLFLVKWLNDPLILQYYEGRDSPHDTEMVNQNFYQQEDNVTCCIIEFEQKAIGYIQFYPLDSQEKKEYGYDDLDDIYGTDQFIGEIDYWDKGIGTRLMKLMIDHLMYKKHSEKIVLDRQAWNQRAIACYEKCGFKKVKYLPKHEYHEGELRDCWLMEYSRYSV
ncbi:GNAT family N-acetyltransferase [Priestia megaterium]|uniref:GNAT family N-acetyltransferase n=1 Tax=Priestia megaterium TaxID=1404 RepID=UPI00263B36EE|nr:GNAT family N-acetyltransferase [Priestia megaterium]MDN4865323.1 GNAT family N-acetyltransferase [Priestia megaterium]